MDIVVKAEELMILWIAMCTTFGTLLFIRGLIDRKKSNK